MLNDYQLAGKVVIVDKMTYAADLQNLSEGPLKKFTIVKADICDSAAMDKVFEEYKPDYVVNFAAESHVDRSIESSTEFVMSNVVGVQVLLDVSRKVGVKRFLQVSTDEVYGDLGLNERPSQETDLLRPSSPYSATKAAADLLVMAYGRTHGMDVVVTRCSNNYGPRQFPEKLIPLAIKRLMAGKKVPVYGTGENVRDWIHVEDHCQGIWLALSQGHKRQVYNFGGGVQVKNIDLVRSLVRMFGKTEEEGIEFVKDRAGHDFRYDINYWKATAELRWKPYVEFEEGLKRTVSWYRNVLTL
jgi:dTDP-glucose 4,6-dehydratase